MKNYRFSAAIDVDDVLMPCIPLARDLDALENPESPIDVNQIKSWLGPNTYGARLIKYFNDPEFFKLQKPCECAQEFIKKLSKKAEIFIVTAVQPEIMGIRMKQIMEYFPEINPKNIIPASRKDIISVDFTLDDGAHNILSSRATYPVIYRRPWNQHLTGILAANNYDEFLNIIDCIEHSYACSEDDFSNPHVFALVGGSGTGKTAIAEELKNYIQIENPRSTTTRPARKGELLTAYNFIDESLFSEKKENGHFAETTMYAGNHYGMEFEEINKILNSNKHCMAVIDINGAMALKMKYPTTIIYIKRDKDKLIDALIKRVEQGETTRQDVVNRIVSLDDEKKNEKVSDYVINNNKDVKDAVNEFIKIISENGGKLFKCSGEENIKNGSKGNFKLA